MSEHDHYFTAAPASADERRRLRVRLGGREVEVEVAPASLLARRARQGHRGAPRRGSGTAAHRQFLLDLGCGWGPVALALALRSPGATVWALDVNERALDLTRRNAEALGLDGRARATTAGRHSPTTCGSDLIWSNPPIRVGKAVLPRAAAAPGCPG